MFRTLSLVLCVVIGSVGVVAGLKKASLTTKAPSPAPVQDLAGEPRGMLVLPEDGRGHFLAAPLVNGIQIQSVIDTGASLIALSQEDAARIGIFPNAEDFKLTISTANGTLQAAPVSLREVRLGGIVKRDVEAVVLPAGRLKVSLLGMSFLRRLSGFQVAKGALFLKD